jgi:uncharacterized protein YcfJ
MLKRKAMGMLLIGTLGLGGICGCENIDANKGTQGAVIGGVGGALAGALVGGHHGRLLGGLIGGAVGAGGGYLIGSSLDKSDHRHRDEAIEAERRARSNPVRVDDVRSARTADINNDGYVTMDEVVAQAHAGLSDDEQIERLRRTGQFFELTPDQENYLQDQGVNPPVVRAMRDLNADIRERALARDADANSRINPDPAFDYNQDR